MLSALKHGLTGDTPEKRPAGSLYDELTGKKKKDKSDADKHGEGDTHRKHRHKEHRQEKLQIVEMRAKARLLQQQQQQQQQQKKKAAVQEGYGTGLAPPDATVESLVIPDADDLLSAVRRDVIAEMVAEEMKHNKKKLELLDNRMKNAMKQGPKASNYSLHEEQEKMRKLIEERLTRRDKGNKKLVVREPHPIITSALHYCSIGKEAAMEFLYAENTIYQFVQLDIRIIRASLDCYANVVHSPINFKVENVWRLAVIAGDWLDHHDHQDVFLKIAAHCYRLLLELCDAKEHPVQYAALLSGQQQVQAELDVVEMRVLMQKSNSELAFTPPSLHGQQMFFFAAK